jgi:hypothetical protein
MTATVCAKALLRPQINLARHDRSVAQKAAGTAIR